MTIIIAVTLNKLLLFFPVSFNLVNNEDFLLYDALTHQLSPISDEEIAGVFIINMCEHLIKGNFGNV